MALCKVENCGFHCFESTAYCSLHFFEFASPEEKAERAAKISAKEQARLQALSDFQRAAAGALHPDDPAENTAALQRIFAEQRLDDNVYFESMKNAITSKSLKPIAGLIAADGLRINTRIPVVELLCTLFGSLRYNTWNTQAADGGLDYVDFVNQILARDDVNAETIDFATVESAIYCRAASTFVPLLLPKIKLTQKILDSARYLCKRPANVPTPERLAIVDLLERKFKEDAKARREELKRIREAEAAANPVPAAPQGAEPEEPRRSKRARGDPVLAELATATATATAMATATTTATNAEQPAGDEEEEAEEPAAAPREFKCEKLGPALSCFIGWPPEEIPKLEVWTCGAFRRGTDEAIHAHHNAAEWSPLFVQCEKLTNQLKGWRPEHDGSEEPWQGFYLTREALASFGVPEGATVREAMSKVLNLPIENGTEGNSHNYYLAARDMGDSRKTFFHNRWYYGFRGNQVDTKKLAKTKTATNYFKAMIVKNTGVQFVVHHPHTCTYGWGLLVAGEAKKLPGAIALMSYTDCEQDHYHHGS